MGVPDGIRDNLRVPGRVRDNLRVPERVLRMCRRHCCAWHDADGGNYSGPTKAVREAHVGVACRFADDRLPWRLLTCVAEVVRNLVACEFAL